MDSTLDLATRVGHTLKAKGLLLATAESCTGGGIAHAITEIAGSSEWFDCGFVTYSNASKNELLDISEALIAQHGAVSEEIAGAMAEGAVANSSSDVAVSTTGIAGPGGAVRASRSAPSASAGAWATRPIPNAWSSRATASRCGPRPWNIRSRAC